MESTFRTGAVIDINEVIKKHKKIIPNLFGAQFEIPVDNRWNQ